MKSKRRYLLLRARVEDNYALSPDELFDSLSSRLRELVGSLGHAKADLRVWKYRGVQNFFVARCKNESLYEVLLATAMVREVSGKRCALDVLRISGTIDGLSK